MCQVLKRQLWGIMHFPCICICTPKLHNSICAYLHWVSVCASARSGQECCAFLQTQTFKSIGFELRHSMEQGGNTGFCSGSGKYPVTDYCLCEPLDPPGAWVYWYSSMRPAGSFCTCVSSLGEKPRTEVCSLPTCCRWYSWNQDGIHSNFFHRKY